MSAAFFDAVLIRRTRYGLTKDSTLSDAALQELVEKAVKHSPSPFNAQGSRVVIVLGDKNTELWDLVKKHYIPLFSGKPELIPVMEDTIAGYVAGYGTIVFFEDEDVVKASQARHPALAPYFPTWAENATGMLQYIVWTALASEGIGASLQHHAAYSSEIPKGIQQQLDVPATWTCTAMMPFGVPAGELAPKTFTELSERVRVVS